MDTEQVIFTAVTVINYSKAPVAPTTYNRQPITVNRGAPNTASRYPTMNRGQVSAISQGPAAPPPNVPYAQPINQPLPLTSTGHPTAYQILISPANLQANRAEPSAPSAPAYAGPLPELRGGEAMPSVSYVPPPGVAVLTSVAYTATRPMSAGKQTHEHYDRAATPPPVAYAPVE